jgi:hypothetical protein
MSFKEAKHVILTANVVSKRDLQLRALATMFSTPALLEHKSELQEKTDPTSMLGIELHLGI